MTARTLLAAGAALGIVAGCSGGIVAREGGGNTGAGGASGMTSTAQTVSAISAGRFFTCALTAAGGVWCWGSIMGFGAAADQSHVPVVVSGLSSDIRAIAAGGFWACALKAAGGVDCWGDNGFGQLGNASTKSSITPVAVSGLQSGVSTVGAGQEQTCALPIAGGVLCWGQNSWGMLGDNSTKGGQTPVAVSGLSSGMSAISSGEGLHMCAITEQGRLLCWGNNNGGQLGNDSHVDSSVPVAVVGLSSGVVTVSLGSGHTCAVTTAGAVVCWGFGGALGNGAPSGSLVPIAVSTLSSGVAAVAAGDSHTCVLTEAGGVLCWGQNSDGQLGNGSTTDSLVPVAVSGLSSGIKAITAGGFHTCALTTAGGVLCWGGNADGQLGNNTTTGSLVPVGVVVP